MRFEEAVRGRRTHKAFRPEPVAREALEALFELARWAPNHNLTNPWRFRVLGPRTLDALKQAAAELEPGSQTKLERAPTLVLCTAALSGDPQQDHEDLLAAGCAAYIVLLGAHARGLAGYWRTPRALREPAGRRALALPPEEVVVGLLYLGHATQKKQAPARAPVPEIARFLP